MQKPQKCGHNNFHSKAGIVNGNYSIVVVSISLWLQLDNDFLAYPPANMPQTEEWEWQEWNKVCTSDSSVWVGTFFARSSPVLVLCHDFPSLLSLPQPEIVRLTTDPNRMLADNVLSQDQCDKLLELAKVGYHHFTVKLNIFANAEITVIIKYVFPFCRTAFQRVTVSFSPSKY